MSFFPRYTVQQGGELRQGNREIVSVGLTMNVSIFVPGLNEVESWVWLRGP
jgi:hypothetical protein